MMKRQVFISHSQKDKKVADIICSSLEAENIGCWIAPRDIPYGNDWAGEITKAIKNSCLFVFLLSKSSNESRQCPKELNIADNARVPIVCIKLDDIELNPSFEYHLSLNQIMSIDSSLLNEQIESICSFIQNKVQNSSIPSANLYKEKSKERTTTEPSARKNATPFFIVIAIFMFIPLNYILATAFGTPNLLPDFIKKALEYIATYQWITVICLIVAVSIYLEYISSFEYLQTNFSDRNIDLEFHGDFQSFMNRLI